MRAAIARLRRTALLRAWSRYGQVRGGLLSGGMAFTGFFSLFPLLALGFTVLGTVARNRPQLQDRIALRVNELIGLHVIGTSAGEGLVSISELSRARVLTLTGIIGVLVLLLAGWGWLDATREGLRAVGGLAPHRVTPLGRARDVLVLAVLGLAVVGSAVAGIALVLVAGDVLRWLGLQRSAPAGTLVAGLSTLILILTYAGILLLLVRLLARVRLPVHDLWPAAALGGAGVEVLNLSGGLLLQRVGGNPLLAASSLLVGVLVWLGLAARLTLVSAALGVIAAEDRGHWPPDADQEPPGPGAGRAGLVQGLAGPEQGPPRPADARIPGRNREDAMPDRSPQPADRRRARTGPPSSPPPAVSPVSPVSPGQPGRPAPGGRFSAARQRAAARQRLEAIRARKAQVQLPEPSFGPRSEDRVTVAAGMVLGATVLVLLRVLARSARTARAALRRSGDVA